MENYKWKNGIEKVDAATNKARNRLKKLFCEEFVKSGFEEADIPVLDYADAYIVNNEYYTAQNHFKSISSNGEVLSLADDLCVGLMNFAQTAIEKRGKLCAGSEVFSFLPEENKKSNEYQIGAIIYGITGIEGEVEIMVDTYNFIRKIGVNSPKIVISNTNVFQGVLNTFATRVESREHLKNILSGKIESDIDYATSQALNNLKNVEGSGQIIQEIAAKIDNKQSIDGLLNLFEICNMFDAYNMNDAVNIKLRYLGENRYDEGMVFYITDENERILAVGSRCDCIKGKESFSCVQVKIVVGDALAVATENKVFDDSQKTVVIAVAETRAAISMAYKIKLDLLKEGMITHTVYNATESEIVHLMDKNKEQVVIYVDGEGKITHS